MFDLFKLSLFLCWQRIITKNMSRLLDKVLIKRVMSPSLLTTRAMLSANLIVPAFHLCSQLVSSIIYSIASSVNKLNKQVNKGYLCFRPFLIFVSLRFHLYIYQCRFTIVQFQNDSSVPPIVSSFFLCPKQRKQIYFIDSSFQIYICYVG